MTVEPVQVKLQFVLEKYGLRPRANFPFSFFSMANEVFFVTDDRGRRFVLKNCLKNRTKELLEVEAAVCDHLRAHGCGAPVVVPAKDGSRVVEYNGDVWMLYEHLAGWSPTWNRPLARWQLRESVRGLARYHRAVSTLDPQLDTGRIRSYDHERILAWVLDLQRQLDADTSGRASVEKMRPLVAWFRSVAEDLPRRLPRDQVDQVEHLMIHGDFHAFNVMFRWRRFSACYDFDFLRRDTKLPDVLWTLQFHQRHLYKKRFGKKLHEPGFVLPLDAVREVEAQGLRDFLRWYRSIYRLSAAELALLPGMRYSQALWTLRFFSLTNSEEECLEHAGWFQWQKDSLERTETTYQEVIDQVLREDA